MRARILFLPIILAILSVALISCKTRKGSAAVVYTTSASGERLVESTVRLNKPEDASSCKVELDGESFQEVDGFGMAITHSTCFNLLSMQQADRTAFLEEIFSREKGMGSSLIRICIGGSDFSMDEFTWCDQKGMENFGPHPLDEGYLFPILDEIMKINPSVKIIGSPWSCPKWMKVTEEDGRSCDSWTGGRLNPECYRDYADYFVRWIGAMEERGFPIYAVTLQNEPLHRGNSMSLYMPWEDQLAFIRQAVGPAFREAGLKTKILVFDHNYNYDETPGQTDYPLHIFSDAEAARYVAGSAWHSYGGDVSTLDKLHAQFPDKEIYFTEASIGTWSPPFEKGLINDFRDIFLGTLSRYGKGVTLWNLMLDEDGRPFRPGGCSTCIGAVTLSSKDHKTIVRNSHYYEVAHCSKVLLPGAVRLGTRGFRADGLTYLWFRNPDGSQAVILLNEGGKEVEVDFVTDRHSVTCSVPAESVQSVRWTD